MRRALDYTRLPPPTVPLAFLLAAPWFGVAAGGVVAWHGAAVFASRWTAPALAAVHLVTLGFLTMTMAGCGENPCVRRQRERSACSGLALTGKLRAEAPLDSSRTYRPLVTSASAHAASSWKRRQSRVFAIAGGTVRFVVRGSGREMRPSRLAMKFA